ncbi:hypothetical protein B9Z55_003141 [Caenorhabditis nigoni]|uniref:F-box domain-containing protein n=1 Tax=Caenorhabditis nigoni TaxID=1611254 RepID=A0A2G5VNU7_9PELO|nr:hypothetical protein B9Z55_003141 [Caenorhabditis nigoni]
MPIALLKFPTDLLREVFGLCEPFELYKLSKCSKWTQRTIMLGGTKKWKINYWGGNAISVYVDDSNYNFIPTDDPENYFQITLGRYNNYMFIEFPNGGAVDAFVYLIETFGIRIAKLLEIPIDSIANVSEAAKVLVDRNMEIEQFGIKNVEEVRDVINFMPLVNQMNITQEFNCFSKFPHNFHFEFVKYSRSIYIDYSSWFTIDQLLDCTCARIYLGHSSFNNHDLDVFLQKWKKTGTFPNLRYLRIHSFQIDNESPIQKMIPPIQTVNNPMVRVAILNSYFDIWDGVRVTKEDGTV